MNVKTLYKGFTLIDGNGGVPQENSYFIVENRRISKIGKVDELQSTEGIEVVDLTGKYVMPGLINSHVHITLEPVGDPFGLIKTESHAKTTIRGVENLKKHLYSGTTFFRDLGAPSGIDLALRDAVNEGLIEGPQFLAAGKCLTMTGGHGWPIGREADGVDEMRKAAREQLKAGADLIKVMATGGVTTPGIEPGSPQLSLEEMKAAIDEAHKAGKKTSSHAQGNQGIKNAILAGIDSIEHGIFLDDEAIELMIKNGVYLVPTLAAPYFIVKYGIEAGVPQYIVDKTKFVMDTHTESFTKAYKAGVKIAMGTDAGTPFNQHDGTPYELILMAKAGMSPMDVLVSSTKNSADLLGILDNYGTLEEGKFADFLVLSENPLYNLETLFDINSVYKLGKKVK